MHCDYDAVKQRLLDAAGMFMGFTRLDGKHAAMIARDSDTDLIEKELPE